MSTRFARLDQTRRVWFRIERNGALLSGISPGSFTVTVVNPSDAATSTPSVVESGQQGGMYYFDLPSAFLTAVGDYGATVVVDNKGPNVKTTFAINIVATQEDIDTIADGAAGTFDRGTDTLEDIANAGGGSTPSAIADAVWDELLSGHTIAGSAGLVLRDLLRMLENRLEVDFAAQELILYEDDGTTELRRWPIETDGAEAVATASGVQTKRKPSVI